MPKFKLSEDIKCPSCGMKADGAVCVEDDTKRPKPGNFSVCFECTTFLKFADDLSLMVLTAEEMRELPEDLQDQLWKMRRGIHTIKSIPPVKKRKLV